MEALDGSIRHLLSLEAPLNAWAAHSAQAEEALISAAGKTSPWLPARKVRWRKISTVTRTLWWHALYPLPDQLWVTLTNLFCQGVVDESDILGSPAA